MANERRGLSVHEILVTCHRKGTKILPQCNNLPPARRSGPAFGGLCWRAGKTESTIIDSVVIRRPLVGVVGGFPQRAARSVTERYQNLRENAPDIGAIGNVQDITVSFRDLLRNRQSQTGAFDIERRGPVESVKDARQ